MQYLISCIALFFAGIWHAHFIRIALPTSTFAWHLWQWCPLLIGAVAFFVLGWTFCVWVVNNRRHSFFGWAGLLAAPFAAAGVGYVLGYHIV